MSFDVQLSIHDDALLRPNVGFCVADFCVPFKFVL